MSRQDRQALVHLLAGFTVWSVGFVAIYSLQALGCAYDWPAHRLVLVCLYGLTVAVLAALAWRPLRADGDPATTLSTAALWANRAALGAGLLTFLPITFTSACL